MSERQRRHGSGHGLGSRIAAAENAVGTSPSATPSAKRAAGAGAAAVAAARVGGSKGAGFFDRMFALPALVASDNDLEALANAMKETTANDPALDNPNIPAGFTYLGQFVDHDITLDLGPLSSQVQDPTMLKNFRTPSLDLDCVYGAGQGPHGFFFRHDQDTAKFLIGTTGQSPDAANVPIPPLPNDLERSRHGAALIGDHRNDENLLVAQTHLAFLKFHNKIVDLIAAQGTPPAARFEEASKLARLHYQWIVLHDFVERLTESGTVAAILQGGRKFYRFKSVPFMPVEFSGAVYRLGHSMVREEYSHNRVFRPRSPRLAPATLQLLFEFTGLSGNLKGELNVPPTPPSKVPVLPSNWIIDWRRFYDFKTPASTPNFEFNPSRRLDPLITPALHTLPGLAGREANLAFRNLRRGVILGLPSGQAVATEMAKKIAFSPLTPAEIATGADGAVAQQKGFHTKTPLWYYILKEAQVRGNGLRLGPVGSRLVAEVFIGLLQGDPDSILGPTGFTPSLPAKAPGTFFMTDLLQFVGDISPIDGISTVPTL